MKADWFCKLGGQPCGPFTVEQLRQLAVAGTINATTEIRRDKDPRWFLAGKVPGLITSAAAAQASAPPTAAPPTRADGAEAAKPRPRLATPVAAPATARSTPPAGVPVGRPVAPVAARAVPAGSTTGGNPALVFNTDAPNSTAAAKKTEPTPGSKPTRKNNNSLLLVASLGGLCLLIAVVGGVLLVLNSQGSDPQIAAAEGDDNAAEAAPESEVATPLTAEAEANPTLPAGNIAKGSVAGGSVAEGEADGSSALAPTEAPPAGKGASSTTKALAQIDSWNSLANRIQLGLRNIARFEVTSVWLAADTAGRPIAMKAPPQTKSADAAGSDKPAGAAKLAPATKPLFVFAEVTVTNTGDEPVHYQSWNASGETAALLVDEAGGALELVPTSETPKVPRLTSTAIPPGGSIEDTLVFRAPADAVQAFRLALPKPALSSRASGYFGIEVPPETLFREAKAAAATQFANRNLTAPGDKAARDEFAELQRQLMADEAPAPAIQPTTAATPASPPADAAKAEGEMAGEKPPESKLRSAEEFDKFLREMDEEGETESDPASAK